MGEISKEDTSEARLTQGKVKPEGTVSSIGKETIKAYTLENAIKYNGKANSSAVLAGLFAEGLEKSKIKDIMPKIQEVLKEVNGLTLEKQKEQFNKLEYKTSKREIREGLPELPNAEKGKVVMRMAPYPSGPLHIGNAKTAVLNDEYVKMYEGKLLLVMDDTIGSEGKPIEPEAYKLIDEGLQWLGVNYDKKIIYKSDRIEKYYAYAEELIKKGYMYVCDCTQNEMHDLKVKGVACGCREYPAEIQFKRWKKMFEAKVGSMTVRLKTDMQDSDPAFRDRVMFKISDRPHPKTGTKYRVYPSMDFSWAIDDHLLGVTHVLRGIDHYMSTRTQDFIRNIFKWKNPEPIYNGHFAVEGVKISKTKGTQEVKAGTYIGWNDPRTWSLQSLKDRGITKEAIRQFILNMGLKKTNTTVPVNVLYTLNKKYLEEVPRYFFIQDPLKITIGGCPELTAKIPLHPNGKLGHRTYQTTQNFLISQQDAENMQDKNYRLMHLLNFKSDKIGLKPRTYSFISEDPNNDLETKFIHWLPHSPYNIPTKIMMPDGTVTKGLGEPELAKLKVGTTIQFERFGFVKLHKRTKDKLEFWFAHN
ncbi:MAG: glutamate--tRNA ligase [Nanoarchaeota archaeon]|nr:glutamate--tRNA ligase [Nanoarchaeota archaeon]